VRQKQIHEACSRSNRLLVTDPFSGSHACFIDEGVRKVIAMTTTAWWSVVGEAVADPVMAVAQ